METPYRLARRVDSNKQSSERNGSKKKGAKMKIELIISNRMNKINIFTRYIPLRQRLAYVFRFDFPA